MQDIMVERWNNKVKPNDDVYILGDFAFRTSEFTCRDIEDLVNKLNGFKTLILGNHDDYINKKAFNTKCFYEIVPYLEIRDNEEQIILCHYPIEIWGGKHHGTIHLHGHTHNEPNQEDKHVQNRYNVGCMYYNYEPVTLQEIKDYWKEIKQ